MEFSFKNVSTSPSSDDTGSEQDVKVLIIGSGPAGLAAALYAARAELEPVVLTGMALGGQVSLTHAVENYPGFPEGIGGMEMVDLFQKQAERFGARLEYDSAAEVDLSNRPFVITTLNDVRYLADTLIITTGASARNLNVPGESELTGRGVSYCGTCDGYFFKDKDVIVVGGGDSAVEEGLFLTRFASTVTIVHRRDELRAGPILESRAKTNPKISFIWNAVVDEIYGNGKVESVKLVDTVTGEERLHPTDGVFIFIGHTPNTDLFKDQLELDERGYIVVDRYMQTNVPGVYAAGEVADSHYRQVITSAGMGAAAAIEAGHFLDGHAERI
jgi:thioredoxin reductase (NADPH)